MVTIALSRDVKVPAADSWRVLGEDFPRISTWASAISKSEGRGPAFGNASCSERVCLSGRTTFVERLTSFDPQNRTLSYDILEGPPGFVTHANNTWRVEGQGPTSRISMNLQITTKGLLGLVAGQALKAALTRQFTRMLADFAAHVEARAGAARPSP